MEKQILEQVEFYFSNSNLPRDKFLRAIVANHPEGYVPIETISSFKRMQTITKGSEDGLKLVTDALKKSKMLEVDKTGKLVRRVTPLPEVDDSKERTVLVNGFKNGCSIEDIKKTLSSFGKLNCIRIWTRSTNGKTASVEFDKKEDMEKFQKVAVEAEEFKDFKVSSPEEMQKMFNERKEQKISKKKDLGERVEQYKKKIEFESGSILRVKEVDPKKIRRSNLKETFEPFGKISFIDFPFGGGFDKKGDDTVGVIRFKNADATKNALEEYKKSTEKFLIGCEKPVVIEVLEKNDEDEYMKAVASSIQNRGFKRKGGGGDRKNGGKRYQKKPKKN